MEILNCFKHSILQIFNYNTMKKIFFPILFILVGFMTSFAQSNSGVEMADALRSSGKIYVVVLVLAVLFIGLGIYLFTLDKKISKLEKNGKKIPM